MTIDPKGMTVTDWCDSMAFVLGSVMTPQKLMDPRKWQDWARGVIQTPQIARFRPPNPDDFKYWDEWARRFNQTVGQLL